MERDITRRQFLKVTAAGTVLLATGLSMEGCDEAAESVRFLTEAERDQVRAAATRVLPLDGETGAAEYIERLLTAFDYDPPRIFAGGPFSGRQPYPDNASGRPSHDRPANAFERFVPLTRVQEIAWRARIFGSQNVPGADYNDAVLGPTNGWLRTYREGLRALDTTSRQQYGAIFVALPPDRQDAVLAQAGSDFVSTLITHTLEAAYAAPEYGANRELVGWRSSRFEGDSQPLGYSVYDEPSQGYRELPDRPLSTPNPDEDFAGLDGAVLELIAGIAAGLGGQRFF